MRTPRLPRLLPLAVCTAVSGCRAPTEAPGPGVDTGPLFEPAGQAGGPGAQGGDGGVGDGNGEGASGGSGETPEEPGPVPAGTWTTAGYRLDADPCGFEDLLEPLGLTTALLLPEVFAVTEDPAGFAIQALEYGAASPVSCALTGTSFVCEPQAVSPTFFGLGELGWRYEVTFEGSLSDEGWLLGEAATRFVGADADALAGLSALGLSLGSCTQVVFLEIAPLG